MLSPELFRSAAAQARFRREVEAAARLTHPHVVAAYDAGEADGRDFLVMEYVEGPNLSELVKRDGPLPVDAGAGVPSPRRPAGWLSPTPPASSTGT